ncbi:unnamed protein product [Adineta steineri]|uniref:Uncharacterized protein n=1 Tax=Adineta steineri TaxID=433720 RepID=A0A819L3T0_9BILA|nr:unnamed protein product [Adineta steineri]
MENYNAYYNLPSNTVLPPELAQFPLGTYLDDDDDDEFRAGYPFSDISDTEIDESSKSDDFLLASDHDILQSCSSNNGTQILTVKKNDQFESTFSNQQEKQTIIPAAFHQTEKREENHKIDTISHNNNNNVGLDGHVLHDIVDKVKETNTGNLTCSHQSKTTH